MALPDDTIERVTTSGLQVAKVLHDFVETEVLPGTGIDGARFWPGLADIVARFAPKNRALLFQRDDLQRRIDEWFRERGSAAHDIAAYKRFLSEIGYLAEEGPSFSIDTANVDQEVLVSGPQLVVPVTNARYALNAVNARWGSLYDALYGTDAVAPPPSGGASGYDAARGAAVISWSRTFLDEALPLSSGSHADVAAYSADRSGFSAQLADGRRVALADPDAFRGSGASAERTGSESFLFVHHGLHLEIVVDRSHPVGQSDPAGVADVILESAMTTIVDFEDSIAAVDPEDRVAAYRNWLGLCNGTLTDTFMKNGREVTRRLAENRKYVGPDGVPFELTGRSLMLVRNVGLLMTDRSVLDEHGRPVPEGMLDAALSALIALHDIARERKLNNRPGAVYVVRPKLHGPAEVAFVDALFAAVEDLLQMPRNTIKLGLMDEERRTTVNLKECVRAAKARIFFINTGFLDRTGDEIHTCMEAGPVIRKADMKGHPWIKTYEEQNVAVGLACGFPGRAQIGKGMWGMPDKMAAMLEQKIGQMRAGANTAWVPSPTAATLHATHYHRVDVGQRQQELAAQPTPNADALFSLPLLEDTMPAPEAIQRELDNNAQGILGYVVRWIDQGIGCSKIPDIDDIGLMEDRATLRISSQHIANWLRHGLVTEEQVMAALRRMATVVDRQNQGDPNYRRLAPDVGDSIAFTAACDLVFKGRVQPNGYTEPLLHAHRIAVKERQRGQAAKLTEADAATGGDRPRAEVA